MLNGFFYMKVLGDVTSWSRPIQLSCFVVPPSKRGKGVYSLMGIGTVVQIIIG